MTKEDLAKKCAKDNEDKAITTTRSKGVLIAIIYNSNKQEEIG